MKKRILSLLMILCMVVGFSPPPTITKVKAGERLSKEVHGIRGTQPFKVINNDMEYYYKGLERNKDTGQLIYKGGWVEQHDNRSHNKFLVPPGWVCDYGGKSSCPGLMESKYYYHDAEGYSGWLTIDKKTPPYFGWDRYQVRDTFPPNPKIGEKRIIGTITDIGIYGGTVYKDGGGTPSTPSGDIIFTPNQSADIPGNRDGWVNQDISVRVNVESSKKRVEMTSYESRSYEYYDECFSTRQECSTSCSTDSKGGSHCSTNCYDVCVGSWVSDSTPCSYKQTWEATELYVAGEGRTAQGSTVSIGPFTIPDGGTITINKEGGREKGKREKVIGGI